MTKKTGGPSTYDVAKLAGVSQMTVSRVMSGKGYASENVVARVQEAAGKLGYVPNRIAGALAGKKAALVGVILPAVSNVVFAEVLQGLNEGLAESGLKPVFGVSGYDQQEEERLVRDMLSWQVSGLVLTGLEHTAATRAMLASHSTAVAEVIDVDGEPIAACFGLSHAKAATDMAQHLLTKGYRRFGYVGCNLERDLRAGKRRKAFVETVVAGGGEFVGEACDDAPSSMLHGRVLTDRLMAAAERPEAIYFSNDDMAAGGLMYCLANGLRVPDDIALASFNGLEFLEALPLQITTSRSPRRKIGLLAGHYLALRNDGKDALDKVELSAELISGQTS
ncbi:LacI family DNA-binding transcriptional regulator [Roseibium limicola]|uniref:LacI family DNA-binding transcriptional regulator n=1 Tax=Roseibium limicola TaxID=2816037 RepID=A0A939J9V8_9HYPH|nr:LacI family DNA-binding transcriptional regulator [Roseibium limicola]MBO0346314.1 LacI family DNA-binding transcriptional regulator [Roseibium limicola]